MVFIQSTLCYVRFVDKFSNVIDASVCASALLSFVKMSISGLMAFSLIKSVSLSSDKII
jgi:hypothetical protein